METKNNMAGPFDLSTPVTKILAVGRWTEKGLDRTARLPVMYKEVTATVALYLTGVIEQWYFQPDGGCVVFIMNLTTAKEAYALLEQLPLGVAGMMAFDFTPLGPITPLRFLLSPEN